MRYVIFWTVMITALFYWSSHANAADWSIKFGPGIVNNTTDGGTKVFGLRREEGLFGGFSYAAEGGGYVDNIGQGRKSAGLFKLQVGVTPGQKEGIFAKAFLGPCVITKTDTQLGSTEQFCTDVGFGVRDSATFMTVGYGHISNAGIFSSINHGRDYLVFEAGCRLW